MESHVEKNRLRTRIPAGYLSSLSWWSSSILELSTRTPPGGNISSMSTDDYLITLKTLFENLTLARVTHTTFDCHKSRSRRDWRASWIPVREVPGFVTATHQALPVKRTTRLTSRAKNIPPLVVFLTHHKVCATSLFNHQVEKAK